MASAIAAARQRINDVGAGGDLDGATPPGEIDLDVDSVADPTELPDGKVIYPPKLHGEPIDTIAGALLDMQQPSRSRFLRLIGPPGTGKSQIARAIAFRLWMQRRRAVETRRGEPFYGFAEMAGGPSSDEFTFRLSGTYSYSAAIGARTRGRRTGARAQKLLRARRARRPTTQPPCPPPGARIVLGSRVAARSSRA